MTFLMFLLGLIALVAGAELLVRGASRLGLALGISPLVIGLTIVSFGTSSPEMAVSVRAALTDHSDIVMGSNIGGTVFNILFILGTCALVAPLIISQQLVWYEVPIMIGAHFLLLFSSLDGKITRLNALFLFLSLICYIIYAIVKGRQEVKPVTDEYEAAFSLSNKRLNALMIGKQCGLIALGLIFCVIGAGWLLDSAVIFARVMGVSELVIGMTIVAAGTSLPEVATSVVATFRGQRDIAVGNVVGSNIFNILGIIGVTGLIAPDGIAVAPSVLRFDLPVAIAACVACLPVFFTGHKISRWEGGVFLGYYIAYTSYLILAAKDHDFLPMYSIMMMWFVIPLTLLTAAIVIYRTSHKYRF